MTGAAGSAVAFHNHFRLLGRLGVHFAPAHEDGMRMALKFFIPAGFGPGLHEPELVVGVNAEFRVHDHAAVGLADGAHAARDQLGLTERQGPAQGLELGDFHFAGSAPFVIDDFHVLAAHLTDNDFVSVIALEDIEFVRRHLAAHDGFAQTIAGVDADQILTGGSAAARSGIGREGRTGDHGIDHLHHADGQRGVLDGPFFLGVFADALVAGFFGQQDGVQNGLAAIGHGAQVIGRGAVPVIGFHNLVRADHVQIGVLQTGKGLFAGVFAGGRRAHGNGRHVVAVFPADSRVGAAYGSVHFRRQINGKDGGLHHDRTLAQLVDAFGRGCETFHNGVDEGTQFGVPLLHFRTRGVVNLLAELADKFLQEVGILVDFRIIPVDARVFAIHDGAHDFAADTGFIQQTMESHGRNGSEMRGLNFLNLADQGRIVVLAPHEEFGFFTQADDIRAGQHQLFLDVFGFRRSLAGCGVFVGHDFLR